MGNFTKQRRYFYEVVAKKDFFKSEIKRLRKKYKIPSKNIIKETQLKDTLDAPKEWLKPKEDTAKLFKLSEELHKLGTRYGLISSSWQLVLWRYIFLRKWDLSSIEQESDHLCMVTDVLTLDEYVLDQTKAHFPILIMISPYAGARDINKHSFADFFDGLQREMQLVVAFACQIAKDLSCFAT